MQCHSLDTHTPKMLAKITSQYELEWRL